jgi:hypothetical protein
MTSRLGAGIPKSFFTVCKERQYFLSNPQNIFLNFSFGQGRVKGYRGRCILETSLLHYGHMWLTFKGTQK